MELNDIAPLMVDNRSIAGGKCYAESGGATGVDFWSMGFRQVGYTLGNVLTPCTLLRAPHNAGICHYETTHLIRLFRQFYLKSFIVTMTGRLASKVAIVTGSSAGLGRAIALAYGREGALVVCADLAPTARAMSPEAGSVPTHEAILQSGGKSSFTICDMTEGRSVEGAVQRAVKEFGRLDIMVNNAGISVESTRQRPLLTHETDTEDFEKTWKVNTRGVFLGCKYAIEQMLKQELKFGIEAGWIINIASVLSLVGLAGSISYVASKGAVSQMTKTIALEYGAQRIHCNEICPGFTKTALLAPFMTPEGAETLAIIGARHPLGGLGSPSDLAGAAIFLASDDATWITGISLPVDGGYIAQ